MADILNIGASALLAAQRGLDVTGQNVANVNTPNYSRQRIEQSARPLGLLSGGVTVDLTRRLNDALLESRLVRGSSETARLNTFDGVAQRVDTLLTDPDSGLASRLDKFFTALSGLAAEPSSTAARQVVLGEAKSLATRFNSLHGELSSLDAEISQRLDLAVSELDDRTAALASINARIATAGATPTNELLDARDKLLQDISSRLSITTVRQDDGSINVMSGSGQPLVVGSRNFALARTNDPYNPGRTELAGSRQLSGGSIGGLLDARRELVDPALEQLGRIAVAVGERVNAAQSQGATLDGAVGGALFAPAQGSALAAAGNTGSANIALGVADAGALTGGDYLLRREAGGWQLTRAGSGEVVPLTGSGTSADPYTAEGLSFTVGGTAADGDSFRLVPAREAAGALRVVLDDPRGLAAADRLSAGASLSNTGSARVGGVSVQDAANPALTTPARVQFTSAGRYSIDGGAEQDWQPGQTIAGPGWSLSLSGTPAAGDAFSVGPTAAGSGDNRNALALAGLADAGVLDGGRTKLATAHSSLVTRIGSTRERAGVARDAAEALQAQAQTERDTLSGVNLDEEAANLLRYQQAYQAAAQIIATANAVFESLLSAARR